MKLVFLSHDGNCNGGAQKCLVDLLKGIHISYPDAEIYVIFPYKGDMIQLCLPYINGYKLIRMQWWLSSDNTRGNLKRKIRFVRKSVKPLIALIRYIRELNPDYGITNTIVIPFLGVVCKYLKIKHYWFIHEIPSDTWSDNSFVFSTKSILKWINCWSNKVFVTSNYTKTYYQQSISDDKLVVIDQAVEFPVSKSIVAPPHHRYTILLVGGFDSNKGQLELLEAVNHIVTNGRDIYCCLVGSDFGFMHVCQEYVVMNKLENHVTFLPFTTDVASCYKSADVLVVCSTLETFGRVTVEAQKSGLPVILSNVGANPERIIDKVNGLLYQKGNVLDLVDKIEILRDVETRAKFSKKISLLNVDKYDIAEFAHHFITSL